MAVYKIFLEKTATLYSNSPLSNTGGDEIVELNADNNGGVSRFLSKVNTETLKEVIGDKIGTAPFSASLDYYIAYATELPETFSLENIPVTITGSLEWDRGNGKKKDSPIDTSGVSWRYIKANEQEPWTDYITGTVTGSYLAGNPGGGTWIESEKTEIRFTNYRPLDLHINVTDTITDIYNDQRENIGFITKLKNDLEISQNSNISLRYFGRNTHTIYPPCITLKWDDSVYNPGTQLLLETDLATVKILNNKGTYQEDSTQVFRLLGRPTYPKRRFRESSAYLQNYVLPQETYWGLKDEHTAEMAIDFQPSTKVSCDEDGSFFKIFMDGLQPERYYRILIKTEIKGSEIVIDDDNIFKIVRHV